MSNAIDLGGLSDPQSVRQLSPQGDWAGMPQPSLPLQGRRILITRSVSQATDFRLGLEAQGATVLEMAALEIVPPSTWEPLDQAIAQLATFDWLILTSANGVQFFMERLQAQGKDARALAGVKIAVVGRKTAASLQQWGLSPDFIPPNYIADALVETFPRTESSSPESSHPESPGLDRLDGLRCLFPRVESGGREVLVQALTEKGAGIVEVPAYQSRCPQVAEAEVLTAIAQRAIDVITFASSKTVDHFWEILGRSPLPPCSFRDWPSALRDVKIASIGPQTSQTCQRRFGRVDLEAHEYTLEGLTQSIVEFYRSV
jgi:uroporphyrinogen III methyltransferase / synthase